MIRVLAVFVMDGVFVFGYTSGFLWMDRVMGVVVVVVVDAVLRVGYKGRGGYCD